MRRVAVVIVAAGEGRRFGAAKQFAVFREKLILDWAIEAFELHDVIDDIILVLPDEREQEKYLARFEKISDVVRGGRRRQDSVVHGFERVKAEETRIVLVHDGVRPLISREVISRVIEETERSGAAIPAVPVEDTIKEGAQGRVVRTLDRSRLYRVQTPQGFSYSILEKALRRAQQDGYYASDEAGLVERQGHPVALVEGDVRNIKITTPTDLKLAEALSGE
jgi:2-C-methyl-D-erythritol 4-phosphate cytidylyltransferase